MTTRKLRYKDIPQSYVNLIAPTPHLESRKSLGFQKQVKEFYMFDVEDIIPYHKQARRVFDEQELQNLAETIKEHGIRQPLSVIKSEEAGKFEVISGERRLRAAKIAGLDKVPCIIVDATENIEEIALIENIQRADLHPVELASAYRSLLDNHTSGNQTQLAQKLGISKASVTEVLKINELPQDIKNHLLSHNVRSSVIIRKLTRLKEPEEMKKILGLEGAKKVERSKRKIADIFMNNGSIELKIATLKLTDKQKSDLCDKLQNFLRALHDTSSEGLIG